MADHRRCHGGVLFLFTVVTLDRRLLFADESARGLLRAAIEQTRQDRPWKVDPIVLLPDKVEYRWPG